MTGKRSAVIGALLTMLTPVATTGYAQQPRAVTLGRPKAEVNEPFTSILSIHEFADGRVVVSDNRDKVVQLVDFAKQTSTQVGRDGGGPGEYAYPQRLYPQRGDTALLYDISNERYLVILPNGKPGATRPAAFPGGYLSDLIGVDNSGNVYIRARKTGAPDNGVRVVLRFNPVTKTIDSITTVAEPQNEMVMARSMPGDMLRMSTNLPYASRDVATVAPDGTVIVARIADYHLERFAPTKPRVSGPATSFQAIAISDKEKRTFMERQIRPGSIISQRNPNAGRGSATPRARSGTPPGINNPDVYDDKGMTWPTRIPAFLEGAVSVDATGRAWIKRTVPHDHPSAEYDVFDTNATRVLTVTLPASTRLVGFGRTSLYLVRIDDDELQHLQRYAMPN